MSEYQAGSWRVNLGGCGFVLEDSDAGQLVQHLEAFLDNKQGHDPYPRGDEPIVVIRGKDEEVHIAVKHAWGEVSREDAENLLAQLKGRRKLADR